MFSVIRVAKTARITGERVISRSDPRLRPRRTVLSSGGIRNIVAANPQMPSPPMVKKAAATLTLSDIIPPSSGPAPIPLMNEALK